MRRILVAPALGGIILMVGCGGLSQRPLAPVQSSAVQGAGGKVRLTLVPPAAQRAAKKVKLDTLSTGAVVYYKSVSGTFDPLLGGQLNSSFNKYTTDDTTQVQVKSTTFTVDQGSITAPALIDMTVYSGYSLNDVAVAFGPVGLIFSPEATLTIVLWGEIDPDAVYAYHTSGTTVTQISTEIVEGKKTWTIILKVPGFSEYSLGDDYVPPPEGGGP